MPRHPRIVNQDDVAPLERTHGEKFALKARSLGMAAGSQKLGCTLYQVPPGKAAFPAHVHHANEEAIYILTGTGTMRLGGEQHPVGPGTTSRCRSAVRRTSSSMRGPFRWGTLCFQRRSRPRSWSIPTRARSP